MKLIHFSERFNSRDLCNNYSMWHRFWTFAHLRVYQSKYCLAITQTKICSEMYYLINANGATEIPSISGELNSYQSLASLSNFFDFFSVNYLDLWHCRLTYWQRYFRFCFLGCNIFRWMNLKYSRQSINNISLLHKRGDFRWYANEKLLI